MLSSRPQRKERHALAGPALRKRYELRIPPTTCKSRPKPHKTGRYTGIDKGLSPRLNRVDDLEYLYGRGLHAVLCQEDKRPVWEYARGWQRTRPTLELILHHDGPVGLIPASVGCSAFDVDGGDPWELAAIYRPLATLASRRKDGWHLYYRDDLARANAQLSLFDGRLWGEVRSGHGYLINWRGHDGWGLLAKGLRRRRGVPFGELLAAIGAEAVTPTPRRRTRPSAYDPALYAATAADVPPLETVGVGQRNVSLFDTVRFWSYGQPRGHDLEEWIYAVGQYAELQNAKFPEPLPEAEAAGVGYSVATWTWAALADLDHRPELQRRRGHQSGRARRDAVAERDAAILEAVMGGASYRGVARELKVAESVVRYVVRRDAPIFEGWGVRNEPNQ